MSAVFIGGVGRIYPRATAKVVAFGGQNYFQRGEGLQHAVGASVVAHGTYAPDFASKEAKASRQRAALVAG